MVCVRARPSVLQDKTSPPKARRFSDLPMASAPAKQEKRSPQKLRRRFFSGVPMKAVSSPRQRDAKPAHTLGEVLAPISQTDLQQLSPEKKRKTNPLSEVVLSDAGTKQFLGACKRKARAKRAKRRRKLQGAWSSEVLELVKSVFGICETSIYFSREQDALFSTVAQIDKVLRRTLTGKPRRRGRNILRCLVQDYKPHDVGSWRPWLLLLIHEGGFGDDAPSMVGGKVAKRFEAYPPEKIKQRLRHNKDIRRKYRKVLRKWRKLPEERMEDAEIAKRSWAERLRKDLREQALEERDGLDVLAEDIHAELQGTGKKATVAVLGQRKYELASAPKFKEELRKAAKREKKPIPAADVGAHVEIDSESASEEPTEVGLNFCETVDLVEKPQLRLIFRVTENLKDGAVGHYRFGLHYTTRFDQVVVRICRARKWMVRDVLLMAERTKGDFVLELSDTPALRSVRRNSVIDMYYTTPPWRKNFAGKARQPVTVTLRDELQKYWFRTRGTEDLTIRRQKDVVAEEDCLYEAGVVSKPPKRQKRLRPCASMNA